MLQEEKEYQYLSPIQAVPKGFLREPIKDTDKAKFHNALSVLLHDLNPDDRENANKGCVKTFLESTFWDSEHYRINVVDDTDLAITDKATGNVVVMFEFKRVGDRGMVRTDDLDRKGMHELVLYYLLEEQEKHNTDICHLVITDGYQYFVFSKGDFWKYFAADKPFADDVLRKEHDPDVTRKYIYDRIISPKVAKVGRLLAYTYFNLHDISPQLGDAGFSGSRKFNALYKVFTPTFLLNRPFDSHYGISEAFYNELLYIMGLQEVCENGRHKIKRMPEGRREHNSLFEQTYALLDDYAFASLEEREETALGLVMVWVNRVIFLKLLETQLINFNGGDGSYAFLNGIGNFDMLHALFFNVLALPEEERQGDLARIFRNVPYLNSSLFEMADVEKAYFSVSGLSNGHMAVMKGTVLRDRNGHVETGDVCVLNYLMRFLDSYDFGAGHGRNGKTIINASVLGLVFEKINGYKDGSYFTPGYVTAYMCRKTLRAAVAKAFNEHYGWHCQTFDELREQLDYTVAGNREEANRIVNGIRVCDPSVGSGHFLVAALNEFIAIKRDLNVLCYHNGDRMRAYKVRIEDEELEVSDVDGEFRYTWGSEEAQMVQQALFEEKRTIIENCLFGADINPKSTEICQLRLWIELLKNAYYYKDAKGVRRLQTLPNIDINIKTGNSLVMHQPLDANLRVVLAGAGLTVEKYREDVAEYKKLDSMEDSPVLGNALEWRYEFPEALDEAGRFTGFDVIIGNPPYGVPVSGEYRQRVEANWEHVPDYEIYYYFMELGHAILKPGGFLSYIIPNTWLFNVNAGRVRRRLLHEWDIMEVLDCTDFPIFSKATVRNSIITMRKYPAPIGDDEAAAATVGYRNTKGLAAESRANDITPFEALTARPLLHTDGKSLIKDFSQNWALAFRLTEKEKHIVEKVKANSFPLKDAFPETSQGLIAYDKRKGQSDDIINSRAYHAHEYHDGYKKWLLGEDVRRYRVRWNGTEYIDYCDGIANPRSPKFFKGRRLLVREITNPSIYAAITDEELYHDPAVIVIKDSGDYPLEAVCGIMNSKLGSFYHFNNSSKATKGVFPKILIADINTFPLPVLDTEEKRTMAAALTSLVDTVRREAADGGDDSATAKAAEAEIDSTVCRLYGLAEEETEYINQQ